MSEKTSYPQLVREAINHLRRLQEKGVHSVYLSRDDVGGAAVVSDEPSGFPTDEPKHVESAMPEPASTVDALDDLRAAVSKCTICALHESRKHTVFGVGTHETKVMFIGEAPGRDEDLKGEPFVGRAGQLLNKILAAIDLTRDDVYITNILKCRPPNNRDPQESEVRCCEEYLKQQIALIKPRYICALGRVSAQWLLQTNAPLGALRTGNYEYEGIPVIATYHPAALLRNPNFKKPCWEDMKKLRGLLDEC
jgi:uracil-DNA glycosylase family 4